MTSYLSPPAESLLKTTTSHRLASLWRIKRTDGVQKRYTSASSTITFEEQEFTPLSGVSASARRKQGGLQSQNIEFQGVINADEITAEDLLEELYAEAQVDEWKIDWMFPFVEPFQHSRYWISEVDFDGEKWVAQIEGLPRWLRNNVGDVHSRNCKWELGQFATRGFGCSVNLSSLTLINLFIVTVIDEHFIFDGPTGSISSGLGDNYFQNGKVIWTTGLNAGHISEVSKYENATRRFHLALPTPFPMVAVAGQRDFIAVPGCDWTRITCIARYNNILDYGGTPDMPGTNAIIKRIND